MEIVRNRIDTGQRYWLVRTDGGKLYQSFIEQKLVAISYPEIRSSEIRQMLNREDLLTELVTRKYPEEQRPGYKVAQLQKFYGEMTAGDLVIIPSRETLQLSIGKVVSDVEDVQVHKRTSQGDLVACEGYTKTRRVEWMKNVPKRLINPKFYKLFFSHHAVVDAKDYANYINSMLFDFYQFGKSFHLVFEINSEEVSALDLFGGFNALLKAADIILNEEGTGREINASVNLNSPGTLELVSEYSKRLFVIGALIIAVNGGHVKVDKIGLDIQTQGLIRGVADFMSSQKDIELKEEIRNKIQGLEIKNPEDIKAILDGINRLE